MPVAASARTDQRQRGLVPEADKGQGRSDKTKRRRKDHPRILSVIGEPGTCLHHDFLAQRVGDTVRIHVRHDAIAHAGDSEPDARKGVEHDHQKCRNLSEIGSAVHDVAMFNFYDQPRGPVNNQHGNRCQTTQERERVQQAKQAALIGRPQRTVDIERYTLQHIAKRDAEDQGRHETANEQRPVPGGTPCPRFPAWTGT